MLKYVWVGFQVDTVLAASGPDAKPPRGLTPHPSPSPTTGASHHFQEQKPKSQRLTSLLGQEHEDGHLQIVNITFSSLIQLSVTHLEVAREPGILEGNLGEGRQNEALEG